MKDLLAFLCMTHKLFTKAIEGQKTQFGQNDPRLLVVIALSETWFTDSTAEIYGLTGYDNEIQYRKVRKGGGVSLLIKENIEYVTRNDWSKFNSHIDS